MATGLYFLTGLLLARGLGATGYGTYAYAMAWVAVLETAAIMGLDGLLVRHMAVYHEQSAWGLASGLLRRASALALLASTVLIVLAAALSAIAGREFDLQTLFTIYIAFVLVPPGALTRLLASAIRGFGHELAAQLPEGLVQPALFVILVVGAYLIAGATLTPAWVMGMNVVATGAGLLVGVHVLRMILPAAVRDAYPAYRTRAWLRGAGPLFVVAAMSVVIARADVLMLGTMVGIEAVGVYTVAKRGADLVTIFLTAANTPLAPMVARLYVRGEMKVLQQVLTRSVRATLVVTLPVALGLILFARRFLLLFGEDFTRGQVALALLSAGQLLNVGAGPVGLLLIMTGFERDVAVAHGISAVVNIALNGLLIPRWGLEGAAAATMSSTILWNVMLTWWVFRRLGIHSSALGTGPFRGGS